VAAAANFGRKAQWDHRTIGFLGIERDIIGYIMVENNPNTHPMKKNHDFFFPICQ
jgi:hypothetical protein